MHIRRQRHWKLTLAAVMVIAATGARAQSAEPAPPPFDEAAMRTTVAAAWQDATTAWTVLLGPRAYDSDIPQINFVKAIRPSHCYGLYVGSGPVYCSGNNTVFVSLEEIERLSGRLGSNASAGLAFLVAHELGHHVQKVIGRFRVLQSMARDNPDQARSLTVRFELEADCLAGVWAGNSTVFAKDPGVQAGILDTIAAIGDDKMRSKDGAAADPLTFTHGTSEQRLRWYRTGFAARTVHACEVLEAPAL